MTEDETVECHHQFYGHPFEQTLGIGDGMPGILQSMQSMGSQRVRHNCVTELN